jgi:phage shock protein PspC (stress-responsive transcriptional regulator)
MSQPAAAPTGGSSANGAPPEPPPGQNQDQWRFKGWGPQGPGQYQGPYAAYAARMGNQQSGPGGPAYSPTAPRPATEPTRRAYRRTEGRVVAGVAGGIADHLGVSDTVVRLVLIATTVSGGFGLLIYAALWFLMPLAPETVPEAPGLAAHTRKGLRTDEPAPPVAEAKQRKREKSRG